MKRINTFLKVVILAFLPSLITMLLYISIGNIQNNIPSLLLFLICAGLVLFPFLYSWSSNKKTRVNLVFLL